MKTKFSASFLSCLFLSSALVAAEAPVQKGEVLFKGDFSSSAAVVEQLGGNLTGVTVADGKLRVPRGASPWWRGREPLEFIAEMRLTVKPAWSKQTKNPDSWVGFAGEGFYCVKPQNSCCFMLAGSIADYRAIPDVKLGTPFTLTLMRRKIADQVKYSYYVNGRHIQDAMAAMPYENMAKSRTAFKQITLFTGGFDLELESLAIYRPKGDAGSPNMIINSSFEFDEEGIPPYFSFNQGFDWKNRPPEEYESRYLKHVRVDTTEKHSGKQSLRVEINNTETSFSFDPVGTALTVPKRAGVFSAWMKASVDRLPVTLVYGGVTRTVTVGRTWKRYEVDATNLPVTEFAMHPITLRVDRPGKYDCVLWVDDLQAEIVQSPEEKEDLARADRRKKAQEAAAETGDFDDATDEDAGTDMISLEDEGPAKRVKGGFDLNKSYASPYRPSDSDGGHYGASRPAAVVAPRGTTPVKTPDEAALRGYELRKGETLVMSRYDYYMNEKVAPFRVWDENGKLAEASIDISRLPCGTNAVTVKAHGKDWPATVVKLPYRKGATQRNFFNRAIVNEGEEIFLSAPMLLARCHVTAKNGRVPIIDWMWKKGFRSLKLALWPDDRYVPPAQAIMKQCAELGMRVTLFTCIDGEAGEPLPTDPILAARAREKAKRENKKSYMTAQEMRDSIEMPHIISWNVIDEPDYGTPSDLARDQLLAFKQKYPYVPCMMNNCYFARNYHYADSVTDVFMLDNYLTNGEWRSIDSVVEQVDMMRLTGYGKPCWYFVIGCNTIHYRQPTFGEQVAQSWGCVCAGATGICWYIEPPSVEPAWQSIDRCNREFMDLKDVIFSEDIVGEAGVDVSSHHLRTMTRRLKGVWYVLSAYMDPTPLEKATFTMPPDGPQDGTIEVLYENRTLPLKAGQFSDAYQPYERHLYRVMK